MAEVKVVFNDVKTGKSYQKAYTDASFLNMKIGDKVAGAQLDLPGYEFILTGGSDSAGFPMRFDVISVGRKRVLLAKGPGLKTIGTPRGFRKKKSVAPNNVNAQTAQVNLKVTTYGPKDLAASLGIQPKEEAKTAPAKA